MNKNIAIIIIIVAIIGGLVFVLAQQYAAQNSGQATNTVAPRIPVKPIQKEAFVGGIDVASSTQQDLQNIDIGDAKSDLNKMDADINSL